jgi:1-acyl-sn-glycerol-3-phosphate acyltransferase
VRVEGAERLRAPGAKLVVANHPSLLDTPMLLALLPEADLVVKSSWADHPALRATVRAAGYLRSEGGPAFVREGARRLRAASTLVIFPEGTRSPREGLGRFQRGAAHLALASGCDLLPVVIRVEPRSLRSDQRWYHVPERTMEFTIRVLEPVSPSKLPGVDEGPALAARRLTRALHRLYEQEIYGSASSSSQAGGTSNAAPANRAPVFG